MRKGISFLTLTFILTCYADSLKAQSSPQNVSYSDQWVATDGLGRVLPGYAEVGPLKANKYVGVFYWLWHAYIRTNPILDVTKELQQTNGNPQWIYQDWYWSEPENGYYHDSDPWVARRNLQMLANAGVDFIYIDYTNGTQGGESFDDFMSVAMDMYNQGIPVPKFVFFLNDDVAGGPGRHVIDDVYNNIYSVGKYQPLWFYWDGKPLIMEGAGSATNAAELNFFTFRDTWAFQADTTDQWRFIDDYPQHPSYHNGVVEQIVVNKSMGAPLVPKNAVNNKGASYTTTGGTPVYDQYMLCPRTPYGDYFEQEWGRVHAVNPPIVCITGWNELTAGAWNFDAGTAAVYNFMGKPCDQDPGHWYFVDEFNAEFNRDIEPMNDGITDNYYYQMVSHIRQYKGMQAPHAASVPQTISIDGNFSEWSNVAPVFADAAGDVQARNFKNVNNSANYTNNTNRNDIIESRTAYDASNIFFYVKCKANISAYTDNNWMLLYIDSDKNSSTGWQGYDYVINMGVNSATQTTVKQWNGSAWTNVGTASYQLNGAQMEISVARSLVGLSGTPSFYFHWNDNPQVLNDIRQFFVNGESAPDRRFNYYYNASAAVSQTPYGGTPAAIPGTIEAEAYDNGGEGIAYHDIDAPNKGAMFRTDGVDIENCAEGGYNISFAETGEWLEYTVNVSATGTYNIDTRVGSLSGGSFHIEFDGVDVTGALNVPATGAWQTWVNVGKTVSLTAGQHIMRFCIDQGGFNMNKYVVTAVVLQTPYSGVPAAIPGVVEVENYDNGGEGVAFHDTEAANLGGQYRPGEGVDIEGCSEGGYNIGWSNAGEWQEYTVDIASAGAYTLVARAASANGGGAFHIEMNGTNVSGTINCGNTGGWQNWTDLSKNVTLSAGQQVMRVYIEAGDVNLNKYTFTPVNNLRSAKPQVVMADETDNPVIFLPNPANSYVKFNIKSDEKLVVSIADVQGRVRMRKNVSPGGTMNVSQLPKGLYLVTVKTSGAVKTGKLLIER